MLEIFHKFIKKYKSMAFWMFGVLTLLYAIDIAAAVWDPYLDLTLYLQICFVVFVLIFVGVKVFMYFKSTRNDDGNEMEMNKIENNAQTPHTETGEVDQPIFEEPIYATIISKALRQKTGNKNGENVIYENLKADRNESSDLQEDEKEPIYMNFCKSTRNDDGNEVELDNIENNAQTPHTETGEVDQPIFEEPIYATIISKKLRQKTGNKDGENVIYENLKADRNESSDLQEDEKEPYMNIV